MPNDHQADLVDLDARKRQTAGGLEGGSSESRLREVERAVERIETKLDSELKHLATRAWVLGGVVGGMVSAALITLATIRLFFPVVSN